MWMYTKNVYVDYDCARDNCWQAAKCCSILALSRAGSPMLHFVFSVFFPPWSCCSLFDKTGTQFRGKGRLNWTRQVTSREQWCANEPARWGVPRGGRGGCRGRSNSLLRKSPIRYARVPASNRIVPYCISGVQFLHQGCSKLIELIKKHVHAKIKRRWLIRFLEIRKLIMFRQIFNYFICYMGTMFLQDNSRCD